MKTQANERASGKGGMPSLLTIEARSRKQSTMTTLRRNAMLALLTLTLSGCAEPQPQKVTTKVTTIQTTQVISLKIGMKGSEAIALAGIPCSPSTIKSIDDGANVTLNYQGHSYVFSKGVLQSVH
jgi:hypothetical protein